MSEGNEGNQGNEGGGEHWSKDFQSDSITSENREAFVKTMSKYSTVEDAAVSRFHGEKQMGEPFKFPESMDKLPDDASRADFTAKARGLLNINIAKDADSFKDMNLRAGLADDAPINEGLGELIKNIAIEKGWPVNVVQDLVEFNNTGLSEFAAEQRTVLHETNAKACNDALAADPTYGSPEKVAEASEFFKRGIMAQATKLGYSAEDTEEIGLAMVDAGITTNPKLAKIMLETFGPMGKEGGTLVGDGAGGGGVKQASPYEAKQREFPNTESCWGNPTDSWDNESRATKQALGYKESA